jgi:hypothetical protein
MGVFICFSIIIYKCVIEPYLEMLRVRGFLSNGNKVINVANDLMEVIDVVAPELEFGVFVEEVGKPLHENCVICLEEFENSVGSHMAISDDKQFKCKISLTVCGHILHSKCLREWIDREARCPLCREELTNENIERW